MKTYIVTKKGKQTKIMADSIEDAIDIYNSLLVKDSKKYIKTPRGQFTLSTKSYEELRNEGWGMHHTHEENGVMYYIVGKDNRAVACVKEKDLKFIKDSLVVNDALENYSSVLSKMKEIEHRYNLFRENQNKYYHKGNVSKSVLEAFKKDSNDIKRLLNVAETRFATYKSEMIKSLDNMYKALTKVNW